MDNGTLYLCSVCNDLLYIIRDDVQVKNEKCIISILETFNREGITRKKYIIVGKRSF